MEAKMLQVAVVEVDIGVVVLEEEHGMVLGLQLAAAAAVHLTLVTI
jgi:hypothetical protein